MSVIWCSQFWPSRGGGTPRSRLITRAVPAAIALAVAVGLPAVAGDPFRDRAPRPISDGAEAAFKALFERGNYPEAQQLAAETLASDPNEPLAPAMLAAIAYLYEDGAGASAFADRTVAAADRLFQQDPLRGELYRAVGQFMQGASTYAAGGLEAIPDALAKLGEVRAAMGRANAIAPDDPEVNLIAGMMDAMLANYLPFGDLDGALARLDRGAPRHLVERGRAIIFRERDRDAEALAAVDRAIAIVPNNPELWHLKAQLLYRLGTKDQNLPQLQEAVALFEQVLAREATLPPETIDHLKDNELRRARRAVCRAQVGQDSC